LLGSTTPPTQRGWQDGAATKPDGPSRRCFDEPVGDEYGGFVVLPHGDDAQLLDASLRQLDRNEIAAGATDEGLAHR
jgi:hypothetical protein